MRHASVGRLATQPTSASVAAVYGVTVLAGWLSHKHTQHNTLFRRQYRLSRPIASCGCCVAFTSADGDNGLTPRQTRTETLMKTDACFSDIGNWCVFGEAEERVRECMSGGLPL